MENSEFHNAREVINDIKQVRLQMNAESIRRSNAEYRISQSIITDEMWIKIKKEAEDKFKLANRKFELLMEKLISFKSLCSNIEWNYLLDELGVVLAQTENINHVADSLFDDDDLRNALDETSSMIETKNEELKEANKENNEDLVVIIKSELKYYDSDMKKHPWGVDRLKNLYYKQDNINNKLGSR